MDAYYIVYANTVPTNNLCMDTVYANTMPTNNVVPKVQLAIRGICAINVVYPNVLPNQVFVHRLQCTQTQ